MKKLHILYVEDSELDFELIKQYLFQAGLECEITRIETYTEFREALESSPYDLILADCALPHFSGMEALQLAQDKTPHIPFIFLSGTIDEKTAIKLLSAGASDYVLKDNLVRLIRAILRTVDSPSERNNIIPTDDQSNK
jgi:DNA-binding response OmpR family regulator